MQSINNALNGRLVSVTSSGALGTNRPLQGGAILDRPQPAAPCRRTMTLRNIDGNYLSTDALNDREHPMLAVRFGRKAQLTRDDAVRRLIVFFMVPDFTMIAFATALEPLRAANRMLGHNRYRWRLASIDGRPVRASNGVECTVDTSLDDERRNLAGSNRPSMVIVCSGLNIENYHQKSVFGFLREVNSRRVAIGGLCTGAYALARAGLLSGRRCVIHWENLPGFAEAFPTANASADLFEVDHNIYTCAGGTAALDMMLQLIGDDFGESVVNRVCEQLLTDRARGPGDRQRLPLRARLGVHNPKVLTTIELMEANLAEPLPLVDIANHVGLSRRQIERLFEKEMGRAPARYYLEIRLDRARHLLMQSSLSVIEVAVACGFVSASHFAKCYRELYARSPQQERGERKQLVFLDKDA